MSTTQQDLEALIARLKAGETVKSTDIIGEHKAMKLMTLVRKLGLPIMTVHKTPRGAGAWYQRQAGRYAVYKLKEPKQ